MEAVKIQAATYGKVSGPDTINLVDRVSVSQIEPFAMGAHSGCHALVMRANVYTSAML
jgi:hypothetical protein